MARLVSAQRLSASTNLITLKSVTLRRLRFLFRCAQRLSASTDGSRPNLAIPRHETAKVLNAFRHQRMDHERFQVGQFGNGFVLNAFRHQRMDHIRCRVSGGMSILCSTPFGINGWITSRCNPKYPSSIVLNAFRHQRMDHLHELVVFAHHPSGVLNAFRHQRMDHTALRNPHTPADP